ncbi:MAG: biotin--[acetyl-CoA-carboxylase] ligase [Lachnospiraceae bacterium]
MTTKEKLLELFESKKGIYFSGEELAKTLSVSRTAVWKAVTNLRNDGYVIDAVTNKGYCLASQTDILSSRGIWKYLKPEYRDMEIEILPTAASTNALVREKANCGAQEGCVVIAKEQTAGRGRYGRTFFSPSGTGVYMSILLRPVSYSSQQATRITTMAATAMCEAIEQLSGETAQIKWVNDIYMEGKKVCGILTEASFDLESGMLEYAVLGVGFNVYPPDEGFPQELEAVAGAIFDDIQDDMKNRLAATFLNRFMEYYTSEDETAYIEKYRDKSLALGKHIMITTQNQTRRAYVYGMDEDCRLLVEYEDGTKESLSCGEIQLALSL